MYPSFLKGLLYQHCPAAEYARLINEGHDISFREQWRLIRYMGRYKNKQIRDIINHTLLKETKEKWNIERRRL